MPTTYAHYSFGDNVLKNLNEDVYNLIINNIDLFNIGLHGPDILFYYKPLKSNKINKIGHDLHKLTANMFFEKARAVINSCPDNNAACAYILGFICHYMLDSECHPYIRRKENNMLNHSIIETEFDRFLMLKNELNPISFKPTTHIMPNYNNAEIISWFFESATKKEVLIALKSMKFYLNFLVAPGNLKRTLIKSGLKLSGNYDNMIGLMMSYESIEECDETNQNLYELYLNAIDPTVKILTEYYENIKGSKGINMRFNKNFE